MALHGFGGSARDFDVVADEIAKRPGVMAFCAVDLCPPMFDVAEDEIRDRVVVGYSMGARVALSAVIRAPGIARALVLVGGTAGIDDVEERKRRKADDASLAREIPIIGAEAFALRWSQRPLIRSQDRMPRPYFKQMLARRREQSAPDLAACLRTVGQGVFEPLWRRLSAVKIPTLLVTGAEDEKYTAIARRMHDALPNAEQVVIDGVGHAAHLEASEVFVEVLESFVVRWGLDR